MIRPAPLSLRSRRPIFPAVVLLGVAAFASAPALAQNGPQVELQGYVAQRCWAAGFSSGAGGSASARCNHVAPLLRSHVRTISVEDRMGEISPGADKATRPDQQSARTAWEIIVSPQL